jgi:hypothetical protein
MTISDFLDRVMELVRALEMAWWKERRQQLPFTASPEEVAAMSSMREGRALVDLLLAQSPAMIFMVAALRQIGRRRICLPGGWLDDYIEMSDTLHTPRQAVAALLQQVWQFHYALEGLDRLAAQGVDLDKIFGMPRKGS